MPALLISYTLWGNGALDVIDQLAWLKARGFEALGFHTNERLAPDRGLDIRELTDADWARLRQVVAGLRGIEVHAPIQDELSLVATDATARRESVHRLSRHLEFAAKLGADVVVVHSGAGENGTTWEQRRAALVDSLRQLEAVCARTGVPLSLEVADDLIVADRLDVLTEVECPHLGICLDVGHIAFQRDGRPGYAHYGSIPGFIEHRGKRLNHVHFHDYDGKRDHLGLGAGHLDLKGILQALRRVGYAGMLALELAPEAVPAEKAAAQKDLLLKWVQEVWEGHEPDRDSRGSVGTTPAGASVEHHGELN